MLERETEEIFLDVYTWKMTMMRCNILSSNKQKVCFCMIHCVQFFFGAEEGKGHKLIYNQLSFSQ